MKWHSQTLWPETQHGGGGQASSEVGIILGVLGRLSRCLFFPILISHADVCGQSMELVILSFPTVAVFTTSPLGLWVFLVLLSQIHLCISEKAMASGVNGVKSPSSECATAHP